MSIKFSGILFLAAAFMLGSCLHSPLREYLDGRVGTMTYAEAVEEWGEPNSVTTENGLIQASWSDFEPGMLYVGQEAGSLPTTHGWRLSLNFDEKTETLKTWNHYYW